MSHKLIAYTALLGTKPKPTKKSFCHWDAAMTTNEKKWYKSEFFFHFSWCCATHLFNVLFHSFIYYKKKPFFISCHSWILPQLIFKYLCIYPDVFTQKMKEWIVFLVLNSTFEKMMMNDCNLSSFLIIFFFYLLLVSFVYFLSF